MGNGAGIARGTLGDGGKSMNLGRQDRQGLNDHKPYLLTLLLMSLKFTQLAILPTDEE